MAADEVISYLKNEYLKNYPFIHERDKLIIFFENLLSVADKNGVSNYFSFFKGRIKYLEKNYDEAKTEFYESLKQDNTFSFSWNGLGNVYREQKENDKAIEAYKKAIELDEKFSFPWNGLGNVYRAQKENDKAIEAYKKAIELDEKFSFPWNGLGNVFSDKNEHDKAIEAYKKAIELDEKFSFPWNGLGNVYSGQKENDKAIEAYKKAIELDEKFSSPWNGLGNVYREQKENDKAIEAYKKAIELDEKFSFPWNGLGIVYKEQKEYDKSTEAYQRAIEMDDTFAIPWYNLGIYYSEQKEYEKAIEAYKKAIEIDDKYASPWNGLAIVFRVQKEYEKAIEAHLKAIQLNIEEGYYYRNLGITYEEMNRYDLAQKSYQESLKRFNKKNDQLNIAIVSRKLNVIEEKIKSTNFLDESEEVEKSGPIAKILEDTTKSGMEKEAMDNKKSFLKFLSEENNNSDNSNYVHVLRRWNSYTPIIADNFHISKGGGYFLKTNSHGIVIDPGFNFIDNFKGAGHLFNEIDTIIVSHAHNDHTSDIESILTLLFEFNQEIKDSADPLKDKTIRNEIAKEKNIKPDDISKEEIEKAFSKSPRRKRINFYLTLSVFKKYSGLFELFSQNDYNLHIIASGMELPIDENIKIKVIKAKHPDIISDRDSVGIIIVSNDCSIIYTGDTGWNNEIEEQYGKISDELQKKYKLLIAHLGGFEEQESYYFTIANKEESFYKNHLGRIGLAKINEILKPDICIISEFGEELKEYRIRIAEIYQKAFDDKIVFLPADIGLYFNLDSKKIHAITNCRPVSNTMDYGFIDPKDVKSILLRKDYSLHYFENSSSIVESDLIQILGAQFDKSKK